MFFLRKLIKIGGSAASKKFQDSEKPFLDHLEDLRTMLFKIIVTLIVSTIVAFLFYKYLIGVINYPLEKAGYPTDLIVLSPFEGFMSVLKVCLYAGLICSFPLILYFIGEFVIPGLNEKEKKLILPVIFASFVLFASGVLFAYFVVIPRALEFFQSFNAGVDIKTELRFKYTVSFVTMMALVFGLCFELPVVVMTLVKLDLLNSKMMRNTRSYAIIAMFIVAAAVTPTPDIFTMSLLAGPMIILYEICIWLAWWLERKAAKAEAAEKERERLELIKQQKQLKAIEAAEESARAKTEAERRAAGGGAGTQPFDPENEAVYDDDGGAPVAEDQSSDVVDADAEPEYHSGLGTIADEVPVDPTSDAVWGYTPGATDSADLHDPDHHDEYGHDHYDPHHYDHSYHDDGYYSGPTEELKRMLREELKADLKESIKAELNSELKAELKAEILAELREEFKGVNGLGDGPQETPA